MLFLHALLSAALVLLFSLYCAGLGGIVGASAISTLSTGSHALRWGLGYFVGTALFASAWRLLSVAIGRADVALGLTFVASLATIGLSSPYRRDLADWAKSLPRHWAELTALVIGCSAISLLFWTQDHNNYSVWAYLGSAHSPRAANIATHIWETNAIPAFGQNYEQSLLASIPLFLGLNHPIFHVWLWVSSSLVALAVGLRGFLGFLGLSPALARTGTFLVLAGNVSLSLFFVRVFDNGTPLLLSGSSDLLRSFGSFLVFFLLLRERSQDSLVARTILVFALFVSWALSAVQNTYLSLGSLGVIAAYTLWKERRVAVMPVAVAMLGGALTAAVMPLGGMLCPIKHRDPAVPGVINYVSIPQPRQFTINPTLPFTVGSEYWDKFVPVPGLTVSELRRQGGQSLRQILYQFELSAWVAIKTAFFPLLGFLLLGFFMWGRAAALIDDKWRDVWGMGVLTSILGVVVVFPLSVSWYRWGLTRFLIVGYTLGSICLVLAMSRSLGAVARGSILPVVWRGLAVLWLVGPFGGFVQQIASNLRSPVLFGKNVADLVAGNGYFDNDHHHTVEQDPSRVPGSQIPLVSRLEEGPADPTAPPRSAAP